MIILFVFVVVVVVEKIDHIDHTNVHQLKTQQKPNEPESLYGTHRQELEQKASFMGLEKDDFVEKRPVEDVGKMIVKETQKIEGDKKEMTQRKEKLNQKIDKKQADLRDETGFAGTRFNKLKEDKD